MRKLIRTSMLYMACAVGAAALAAPGEYWEISTKMEMAGMPFAMPATTSKVCMAKGNEKDPKYTADKECQVTDVKHAGNTTSWKVRCDRKGEVINGSGEMTGTPDKSDGTIRMNGVSGGQRIDMTQTYSSRRIGGACDTEEQVNKIKGQVCDTTGFGTAQWISSANLYLEGDTCPGKKEPLCAAVRRDAPRDAGIYNLLVNMEKNNGGLVTRACGLNMEATTRAICKTVNSNTVSSLAQHCPAEVKAYREEARRKACEGRSYTGKEDLSKCLAGGRGDGAGAGAGAMSDDSAGFGAARSSRGNVGGAVEPQPAEKPAAPANPAGAVMDGAKKLKGLFGL